MRMARLLRLEVARTTDDAIMREIKRRVWWTLYMIDRWSAAGLGLSRQFYSGSGSPDLPMHELTFHHMTKGEFDLNRSMQEPGLWAHMIKLVKIFGHVQDLHQRLANAELAEDVVESSIGSIVENLEIYKQGLPPSLHLSYNNLCLHARQGIGRTFVALHLGYHHYATLLYFQYLDTQHLESGNRALYARRCKQHAANFSDLLRMAHEEADCAAVYNIVAHMTVVSSSVLLYTLLFGEEDELPSARQRLESNFELLTELRQYWPSVRLMVSRDQPSIIITALTGRLDGPPFHVPKCLLLVSNPEHSQN